MQQDDINKDGNGKYSPKYPKNLDRPLKHGEMDYNLDLIGNTIKGYLVMGSGPDGDIDLTNDVDKVLQLYKVTAEDLNYISNGAEIGDYVWIPVDSVGRVVKSDLIPDADVAYDLGSPTNKFRDLYLSNNTLYLGDHSISVKDGKLGLNGTFIDFDAIEDDDIQSIIGNISSVEIAASTDILEINNSIGDRVNSINTQTSSDLFEANDSIGTRVSDLQNLLSGQISSETIKIDQKIDSVDVSLSNDIVAADASIRNEMNTLVTDTEAFAQLRTSIETNFTTGSSETYAGLESLSVFLTDADEAFISEARVLNAGISNELSSANISIGEELTAITNEDGILAGLEESLRAEISSERLTSKADISELTTIALSADEVVITEAKSLIGTLSSDEYNITAGLQSDILVNVTSNEALAQQLNKLDAKVSTDAIATNAAISSAALAYTDSNEALAQELNKLTAEISGDDLVTNAAISSAAVAYVTSAEALAQELNKLDAKVSTEKVLSSASIDQIQTTLANQDFASASKVDTLAAEFTFDDDDNITGLQANRAIATEITNAVATETGAAVLEATENIASVGELVAGVSTESFASIDTLTSTINAQYTLQVETNDSNGVPVVAGMKLGANENGSAIAFTADSFKISTGGPQGELLTPFSIEGGQVAFTGAVSFSKGTQGPAGPQGAEGDQGLQGPQGIQGLPGAQGASGSAGVSARAVSLAAPFQAFAYNASGSTPLPINTVITATTFNTTGTVYYNFYKNDVSVQHSTTRTYTYTPQSSYSNMPDTIEVEIREGSKTSAILARDQITMAGIKPGIDAMTVILTNEAHTLPTQTDGTVEYAGSGTIISVYDGFNKLVSDGVGTSPGKYKVTAVGASITVGSAANFFGDRKFADHKLMTANTAKIRYTITGRTIVGTSFSFKKEQTFAKSLQGDQGDAGPQGPKGDQGPAPDTSTYLTKSTIIDGGTITTGILKNGEFEIDGASHVNQLKDKPWNTYSDAGMGINLDKGAINAQNFYIDPAGNAEFRGNLVVGDQLLTEDNTLNENNPTNVFYTFSSEAGVVTPTNRTEATANVYTFESNKESTAKLKLVMTGADGQRNHNNSDVEILTTRDLTQWGRWTANSTYQPAVTGDKSDPFGGNDAYELKRNNAQIYYLNIGYDDVVNQESRASVWLKGTGFATMKIQDNNSEGYGYDTWYSHTIELTNTWTKYEFTGYIGDDNGQDVRFLFERTTGSDLGVSANMQVFAPSLKLEPTYTNAQAKFNGVYLNTVLNHDIVGAGNAEKATFVDTVKVKKGWNTIKIWSNTTDYSRTYEIEVADIQTDRIESGSLGGWSIDDSTLYAGFKNTEGYTEKGITISSKNGGSIHAKNFYIDTIGNAFFKGNISGSTINGGTLNIGNGTFSVTNSGILSATNANITGDINATGGKIGEWEIDSETKSLRDSDSELELYPGISGGDPAEIRMYSNNIKKVSISSKGNLTSLDNTVTDVTMGNTYNIPNVLSNSTNHDWVTGNSYTTLSSATYTVTEVGDYEVFVNKPSFQVEAAATVSNNKTDPPTYPPNDAEIGHGFSPTRAVHWATIYLQAVESTTNNVVGEIALNRSYSYGALGAYTLYYNDNYDPEYYQWDEYSLSYLQPSNSAAVLVNNAQLTMSINKATTIKFRYRIEFKAKSGIRRNTDSGGNTTITYIQTRADQWTTAPTLDTQIKIQTPSNFIELGPGGAQIVSSNSRYAKILKVDPNSDNQTIFEVKGGITKTHDIEPINYGSDVSSIGKSSRFDKIRAHDGDFDRRLDTGNQYANTENLSNLLVTPGFYMRHGIYKPYKIGTLSTYTGSKTYASNNSGTYTNATKMLANYNFIRTTENNKNWYIQLPYNIDSSLIGWTVTFFNADDSGSTIYLKNAFPSATSNTSGVYQVGGGQVVTFTYMGYAQYYDNNRADDFWLRTSYIDNNW